MQQMSVRLTFLSALFALLLTGSIAGEERITIPVWPGIAPGESGDVGKERTLPRKPGPGGYTRVINVTKPTLTLFQPPREQATGCCVMICPGGAFRTLGIDIEGTEIAEWLNSLGVTAVVLKYRVPRRSEEAPYVAPLQDAQRGLRVIRSHAEEWRVDPERLGMIGFSSGGQLAVLAGTTFNEPAYEAFDTIDELSCRPDFLISIYGSYLGDKDDPTKLSPWIRVSKETPPTFQAVTHDDRMRAVHAALLFAELKKADVPAELHIYSRGGHRYGLRPSRDPVSSWPKRCADWLTTSGLLRHQR